MEQSLLLQLRVVPEEQIRLAVEDLTGQFCILVKVNLPSREARVDTDHAV